MKMLPQENEWKMRWKMLIVFVFIMFPEEDR